MKMVKWWNEDDDLVLPSSSSSSSSQVYLPSLSTFLSSKLPFTGMWKWNIKHVSPHVVGNMPLGEKHVDNKSGNNCVDINSSDSRNKYPKYH